MKKKLYTLIATGLGIGFSPIAPGTLGAVEGLIIAILLNYTSNCPYTILSILIIFFFFVGTIVSDRLEKDWGKDPSKIVIDEVVGMWIALLMLPIGWSNMIIAFILFRLFDIYKPLFIKKVEKLKGGWGIMMDDVVAGIYANIIIQLFYVFTK